MATQFIRGDVIEVPLPSDYQDQACLPLVIMQPTADATNYMLKSNYATNGQPGVVDHAILADQATTVLWNDITNLPSLFPPSPHALSHLASGNDGIPNASPLMNGLCPKGSGAVLDYLGGDNVFHPLPVIDRYKSEGPVSIVPADTGGSQILSSIISNPSAGVYSLAQCYVYAPKLTQGAMAGTIHFEVYDTTIPGWTQVTSSTDISIMNSKTFFLPLILTSGAMSQVFPAAPNSLAWRIILDQAPGIAVYFQAGIVFFLEVLTALPS
jgi:hypothetical protein